MDAAGDWTSKCKNANFDVNTGLISAVCCCDSTAYLNYYMCLPGAGVYEDNGMLKCKNSNQETAYNMNIPGAPVQLPGVMKLKTNMYLLPATLVPV